MSKTVQIEKPAAALSNAVMSNMVTAATTTVKSKEDRAAERAKRFPQAAAAEAAKAKGEAKPASKAVKKDKPAKVIAPKAVSVPVADRRAVAGKPVYCVIADSRPQSGRALFAHTHAALTMFGLFDPKAKPVPRKVMAEVMGQTAVAYHMAQGNFESRKDDTVALSGAGREKFAKRGIDGKLANGYLGVFLDGKPFGDVSKAAILRIA